MLDIIEHLAVDYVPGVRALRNLRRSVQSLAKMKREREFLAQKLLPHLSAQLLHRLAPWTSPSVRLVRIGHQGCVMGDMWEDIDAVYAFGDASDCSWQQYFVDRSLPVFIHDHGAEKKSLCKPHPSIHFSRTGICGFPQQGGMKDMGTLIRENGHAGCRLAMKMDIEQLSYPALQALSSADMSCFRQIFFKAYDLEGLLFDIEQHFIIVECLEKILDYMYCVHIHADNRFPIVERGGVKVPMVLELSFIAKESADGFVRADRLCSELDQPRCSIQDEFDISGLWKQSSVFGFS